jgi:hypothetical protein
MVILSIRRTDSRSVGPEFTCCLGRAPAGSAPHLKTAGGELVTASGCHPGDERSPKTVGRLGVRWPEPDLLRPHRLRAPAVRRRRAPHARRLGDLHLRRRVPAHTSHHWGGREVFTATKLPSPTPSSLSPDTASRACGTVVRKPSVNRSGIRPYRHGGRSRTVVRYRPRFGVRPRSPPGGAGESATW